MNRSIRIGKGNMSSSSVWIKTLISITKGDFNLLRRASISVAPPAELILCSGGRRGVLNPNSSL